MKLSDKEKRIFTAAQFRTHLPVHEIVHRCGYRDHTVRYVLKSLSSRGVFSTRSMINVRLLGLTRFALFFSLARESKKLKESFFRGVIANDCVAWVREFGGELPYVFDMVVPGIDEVMSTLNGLTSRFGDLFFEKSLAVRYRIMYFERSYLAPATSSNEIREEPPLMKGQQPIHIDDVDHRILSTIGAAPEISDAGLAQQVKIPRSTLTYRVQQLREKGILLPPFLDLNPRVANIFAYRLLIKTRGTWAQKSGELVRFLQMKKHFVSLIMCMGPWDFETTMEVEDPRLATTLVTELYEAFPESISEVKLLPVFEEPKDTMYPFKRYPFA